MNVKIPRQEDIKAEAMQVLWSHLPPSKMALIVSQWFTDGGDYLKMRDELFEEESVASLVAKIQNFQNEHDQRVNPSNIGDRPPA